MDHNDLNQIIYVAKRIGFSLTIFGGLLLFPVLYHRIFKSDSKEKKGSIGNLFHIIYFAICMVLVIVATFLLYADQLYSLSAKVITFIGVIFQIIPLTKDEFPDHLDLLRRISLIVITIGLGLSFLELSKVPIEEKPSACTRLISAGDFETTFYGSIIDETHGKQFVSLFIRNVTFKEDKIFFNFMANMDDQDLTGSGELSVRDSTISFSDLLGINKWSCSKDKIIISNEDYFSGTTIILEEE